MERNLFIIALKRFLRCRRLLQHLQQNVLTCFSFKSINPSLFLHSLNSTQWVIWKKVFIKEIRRRLRANDKVRRKLTYYYYFEGWFPNWFFSPFAKLKIIHHFSFLYYTPSKQCPLQNKMFLYC